MMKITYLIFIVLFINQGVLFAQKRSQISLENSAINHSSERVDLLNHLEIYPNPASHKIVIRNTSTEDVAVTIFNIVGDPLVRKHSGTEDIEINIEDLSDGFYIIALSNGSEVVTQRLVKQS